MLNPSEIIDNMINFESQCISKYESYIAIYSDINHLVSNGTPLNNIILPNVYANIRILLPECGDKIGEIGTIVNNSLTVYDIYEIYAEDNKTEEAKNSLKTLEGFLTNLNMLLKQFNAISLQIEQHLNIAKTRMETPII